MTVAELQSRVIAPARFVVLGVPLRPLTVGHLDIMAAHQVDRVETPAELVAAVLICSMPPARAERFTRWPPWALGLFLRLFMLTRGRWDFLAKRALFLEFLTYHADLPDVFREDTKGEPSVIPFTQYLRVRLLTSLGYSPADVRDVPYLRALWDLVTWLEMQGKAVVRDSTEDESDPTMTEAEEAAFLARAEAAFDSRLAAEDGGEG